MKGLLGRSPNSFGKGKGLWILPSDGIHTIGMSFPIDAVYLDAKGRVLCAYHKLAPYRIAVIKFKSKSVLELPAGVLAESRTQVGDLVMFLILEESQCGLRAAGAS